MTTKNYATIDDAMEISADRHYVRIMLKGANPPVQLNISIDMANELVSRLQRTIEAAELLSRLEKEGR